MNKVIIKKNRVTFIATNEFTHDIECRSFTERYTILLRSRWSLLYLYFKHYAVEHGKKGCYIGEKRDKDGCYYDIWDLSKVFPEVSFKENDYSNL